MLLVEPADHTGFDGLGEIDEESKGVRIRVVDADQDTYGEMLFHIPSDATDFRSGGRIKLTPTSLPTGTELRIVGLAADRRRQQIGGGSVELDTRDRPLAFREGQEVRAEIALACFCNGGRGCRAMREEDVQNCGPSTEAFCGDLLNNDTGDTRADCADPDCYGQPGPCEQCAPEVCDNNRDDNCDGVRDCSDWQCVQQPVCAGARPEICIGGEDEDLDGAIDCFDSDCDHAPGCHDCSTRRDEICDNLADDDCDHLIDCLDPDCEQERPLVEERCNDGFDDDCDGLADCFDADCLVSAHCDCPRGEREICIDRFDTDCDGKTDCEDPDCADARVVETPDNPGTCSDGIDNDCNGVSDCLESGCASRRGELVEVCADGRDNDCDGAIDCDDSDCRPENPEDRIETNCFDFVDNDCDLLVDCADPDCHAGPESCWNFRDDDCDGRWDCSDDDCFGREVCEGYGRERCANGADEDGDGWVDCEDEDCLLDAACL